MIVCTLPYLKENTSILWLFAKILKVVSVDVRPLSRGLDKKNEMAIYRRFGMEYIVWTMTRFPMETQWFYAKLRLRFVKLGKHITYSKVSMTIQLYIIL